MKRSHSCRLTSFVALATACSAALMPAPALAHRHSHRRASGAASHRPARPCPARTRKRPGHGPRRCASLARGGVLSASFSSPGTPELTVGKTTVGALPDSFLADRKRVNRYALPSAGEVTALNVYLLYATFAG